MPESRILSDSRVFSRQYGILEGIRVFFTVRAILGFQLVGWLVQVLKKLTSHLHRPLPAFEGKKVRFFRQQWSFGVVSSGLLRSIEGFFIFIIAVWQRLLKCRSERGEVVLAACVKGHFL